MKIKNIIFRILFYVAGLMILAFGVAFSVNSNLGVSPINSLPYVISLITNIELGACVVGVFSVYILAQIIVLRKEFKWINLTQILFSTLFGYFVNFAKTVLGDFTIPTYAGKLVMLAISIALVAVGISVYVDTNIVNMPMEGMTAAIASKLQGKTFHQVKIFLDCTVVIIAALLSLVFLHELNGVREGTVICALLVGQLMRPLQKIINPIVNKFCFEK
ncbi:MAG: DUF6198 family protein [Ruthenibacterium sp.]